MLLLVAAAGLYVSLTAAAEPDHSRVPGVVIDHLPAASRQYIGSPSIAILPDGAYVAAHDIFGPGSTFSRTVLLASTDRGHSWQRRAVIEGAFWSTLFMHRDALYLMGASKQFGNTVIRRSDDGGRTWTEPQDGNSGLLLDDGQYHCSPQPVLIHNGRIWRAMEDGRNGLIWGLRFRAFMMSAPVDADLLRADSWTCSDRLARDPKWLDGKFGGWLEGNAVATPEGRVVNILRVDYPTGGGKAATITICDDGRTSSFDPETGFYDFPGGSTKFTIRFDPVSKHYWSLANWVPQRHRDQGRKPAATRNTLALIRSADLRNWEVRSIVAYHPDVVKHGFQYPDWLFDGDDLVAVSRTAYDDGLGGANNFHDANYLTFHRIADFRSADHVELPPLPPPPLVTDEGRDFAVAGHGFQIATLADDALAYGNRNYVWKQVPPTLRNWRYTKTDGGVAATIRVTARRDGAVFVATVPSPQGVRLGGWEPLPGLEFHYTDGGKTKLAVFTRRVAAGDSFELPQFNWTGTLVLIPPDGETPAPGGLVRLPYNHPGLTVDLGVGLWAWPLPMDWDGDGDLDLVVSCNDVPYNGIWLFENPGGGDKLPVFKPAVRVGPGFANISPSYADGQVRVLVPGQELTNFRQSLFAERQPVYPQAQIHPGKLRANQWKVVDYDGDGPMDIVVGVGDWTEYGWDDAFNAEGKWTNGPLHGYVYLIRNRGTSGEPEYDEPVQVVADGQPVDVFGMPSPNFADFDGDGDLDLLCGEFIDGFTYFENIGTRTAPKYAAGRKLLLDGQSLTMDLCMIVPVAIDWDGDGDVDLIVGQEDGRVALLEHTGRFADGLPLFAAPQFFQQQADWVKFGALATPFGFDWDDDGDEDIICGNTAGHVGFIENLGTPPGSATPQWAAPVLLQAGGETLRIMAGYNGSIQGPCEAKWGYTTLSVADWDHDGLPDLVVNSIWGRVVWYRNVGTRKHPQLAAAQPVEVQWQGTPPKPAWNWWDPQGNALATQWRTTPVVIDLNRDGLNDLVMLDHEGYLAYYERRNLDGQLQLMPPQRVFRLASGAAADASSPAADRAGDVMQLNAGRAGRSGRRKLCFADWDGDGQLDLLVNSSNTSFFRNVSSPESAWTFRDSGPVALWRLAGHTTSPTVVDWNLDGRPDLLIGGEDGLFYYLPNPQSTPQAE
jgi:hypothetical protein